MVVGTYIKSHTFICCLLCDRNSSGFVRVPVIFKTKKACRPIRLIHRSPLIHTQLYPNVGQWVGNSFQATSRGGLFVGGWGNYWVWERAMGVNHQSYKEDSFFLKAGGRLLKLKMRVRATLWRVLTDMLRSLNILETRKSTHVDTYVCMCGRNTTTEHSNRSPKYLWASVCGGKKFSNTM